MIAQCHLVFPPGDAAKLETNHLAIKPPPLQLETDRTPDAAAAADRAFDKLDMNRDGVIDRREFSKAVEEGSLGVVAATEVSTLSMGTPTEQLETPVRRSSVSQRSVSPTGAYRLHPC